MLDLVEIWTNLAKYDESSADRLLNRIEQRYQQLAMFPEGAETCEHLRPRLRRSTLEAYVIYFRITLDGIEIVRVLHGSRDANQLL